MARKRRKGSGPEVRSVTSRRKQVFSPNKKCNDLKKRTASLAPSKRPSVGKRCANQLVDSRNADDAMRESHAIAHALMNAAKDAVSIMDGDGIFLDANETVCKRFGISRELLVGRPAWDFFPAEVSKLRKTIFQEACKSSKVVRFQDEREGRYFDHVIYPVVESEGSSNKFVVIARDITELKQTEKTLRENEERYRLVVERTSDLVSITTFSDPPHYVYVNHSYHVILGYRPEDLIGKSPFDFMHPEDRERHAPMLRRYLDAKSQGLLIGGGKGPTERLLYRLQDSRGNWRYMEGTADLIKEERVLMVSKDVSARIKAEQDLEEARKELEEKVEERTRELKMKSQSLEDTNHALKVLLEMRDRDRKELQETVLFNVTQLAEPYLEKLRKCSLDENAKKHLDILSLSLKEIVSPLARNLVVSERNLTASEVRVADLIMLGKSSKEIADMLNLSIRTIETHRHNLRTKLGLEKTKRNLQSYLRDRSNP